MFAKPVPKSKEKGFLQNLHFVVQTETSHSITNILYLPDGCHRTLCGSRYAIQQGYPFDFEAVDILLGNLESFERWIFQSSYVKRNVNF